MNKNKEEDNYKKYILKKESYLKPLFIQNDKEPFKFLNLRYIFLENSNITFLNS